MADGGEGGWEAPALAPWLGAALDQVSDDWFGQPSVAMGEAAHRSIEEGRTVALSELGL